MRVVFSTLQHNRLLPRNPFLRALLATIGVLLMFGLLFFGLIAGAVLLTAGAIALLVRRWLPRRARRREDGVIEGEFRVVDAPARESLPRGQERV